MSSIQAIMAELQSGEAAKARVPELERSIHDLKLRIDGLERHNQGLELRAKERDELISSQTGEIHRLREERDDASFRELEAQDRLAQFEKAVGAAWGGLGNAINALHPPKAEPVKEEPKLEPITKPIFKPGDPLPGEEPAGQSGTGQSDPHPSSNHSTAGQTSGGGGEGQREANPTASGTANPQVPSPQPAVSGGAGTTAAAASGGDWKPSVEMPEVKPEEPAVYKPFSDPPKPNYDNDKSWNTF